MSIQLGPVGRTMRERQKRRVFFQAAGITFVTGLFFAAIFLTHSSSIAFQTFRREPTVETPPGTVAVMVANSDIKKGTKLSAENVRKVPWPRDSVPEGAARTLDEVENKYATADLTDSLPVGLASLSREAPSFNIGQQLPPGYRAVAIGVTATSNVEGRTNPGSHVDVLLTYTDPRDGQVVTTVVAENALVVSFGGDAEGTMRERQNRTSDEIRTSTATLAVKLKDAMAIQTALEMGRLSLVIRSSKDLDSPRDKIFRGTEIGGRVPQRLGAPSKRDGGRASVRYVDENGETQEAHLTKDGLESDLQP